jgi:hypothetical protein
MLEYLEIMFEEQYHILKQDTDTKIAKVVSIQSKVLKLN